MPHASQAAGFAVCNHRETFGFPGVREDLGAVEKAGKAFANHHPAMAHRLTTTLEFVPLSAQMLRVQARSLKITARPTLSFIR
jgi:hypothetical protein